MIIERKQITGLMLTALLCCNIAQAKFSDFTGSRVQDRTASPSPSVSESNVNDYTNMDDQLNLTPDSGQTVVLRTDQKIGLNDYKPYLIEVQNMDNTAVRELLPVMRRITGMEGGFAQIVRDTAKKQRYVQVTCTPEQFPFIQQTVRVMDKAWLNSTNDGTGIEFYAANYRDVDVIDRLARVYAEGFSVVDAEANSVVYQNTVSLSQEYLRAARDIDIPAHEITVNAKFYEVNKNNDQKIGLDYIEWKNSAGFDLFSLGASSLHQSGLDTIRNQNYGYNLFVTASFYDFLNAKGKAKVLANATLQTVSGAAAVWSSMDKNRAIVSSGITRNGQRPSLQPTTFNLNSEVNINGVVLSQGLIDMYLELVSGPSQSDAVHHGIDVNLNVDDFDFLSLVNAQMNAGALNTNVGFVGRGYYWAGSGFAVSSPDFPSGLGIIGDYIFVGYDDNQLRSFSPDTIFRILKIIYGSDTAASIRARFTDQFETTFHGSDYGRTLSFANTSSAGELGLTLEILPVVGTESTEMFIFANSANLSGFDIDGFPRITESQVETTVRVKDGEQIVLAGLTRTEKIKQKVGAPFFSDLPLIGYLFGGETKFDRTKNLIIVLDTTISAGLVRAGSLAPLTAAEVTDLKSRNAFGEMKPASMAISEANKIVMSQATDTAADGQDLDVPFNPFGFDQWLLDPAKRN